MTEPKPTSGGFKAIGVSGNSGYIGIASCLGFPETGRIRYFPLRRFVWPAFYFIQPILPTKKDLIISGKGEGVTKGCEGSSVISFPGIGSL